MKQHSLLSLSVFFAKLFAGKKDTFVRWLNVNLSYKTRRRGSDKLITLHRFIPVAQLPF